MSKEANFNVQNKHYGITTGGESVEEYTMSDPSGFEIKIITYGGIITSLKIPDKNNNYQNVVLGLDSLKDYERDSFYLGAIIGRYGNRIKDGKFTIDGNDYALEVNNGPNHLHGGDRGLNKVVWNAKTSVTENSASLELAYLSKDGDGGYPGSLQTKVIYTITSDCFLDIHYEATTDKKTIVNLTQHSYFNLSANFDETILDHEVQIDADRFLPIDENSIPTGEFKNVVGTPFNFLNPICVKDRLDGLHHSEQLTRGNGFDHCWVFHGQDDGYRSVGSAYHKESGRYLQVLTDQPGVQFYTGNYLDGKKFSKRTGFCFETQHFPNSPNEKDFPSVILNPGEVYQTRTSYRSSIK